MIVSFKFTYSGDNQLLAYLLDFYAKKSGLKYSLFIEKNDTTLYIDGDEEDILKFGDHSMSLIANSVFLAQSKVEVVDEAPSSNVSFGDISFANITPSVAKNYHENGQICKNEFGVLSEIYIQKDGVFEAVDEVNFNVMLDEAFLQLKHYQKLRLKSAHFEFELSSGLDFNEASFVMPTNFGALTKVFIADEKSQIAIASFEKPILSLKTNAIFRKNHPAAPSFFDVKMASDLFIYALLERLYKDEIFFVSVKTTKKDFEPFKIATLDESFLIINHANFISRQSLDFLNGQSNKNLALFSLICDEYDLANKDIVRVFLSKNYDDEIEIYHDKSALKMLDFVIPSTFEELAKIIRSDEIGAKLYDNFHINYSFPSGEIQTKKSFYGLYEIASKILFDQDGEYLLRCSGEFLGSQGIKIDHKIIGKNEFDISKFIRSAMSYKLAGVDDKVLSYGFINSLYYFISDYLDLLKEEFIFDGVILCGSLFTQRELSNLTLKFTAKPHNAKFSTKFGLEMR